MPVIPRLIFHTVVVQLWRDESAAWIGSSISRGASDLSRWCFFRTRRQIAGHPPRDAAFRGSRENSPPSRALQGGSAPVKISLRHL